MEKNSQFLVDLQDYKCGCIGLPVNVHQKDSKPIQLPLTKILFKTEIINGVSSVEMDQTYVNNSGSYLQLQYRFPVAPNACISKFVAIFGNKRMEGVVKEKHIAVFQYDEAVKLGKKATYGERDENSKDVLILQIGNIGPNQTVRIEISYVQELSISYNTFYQFHLITQHTPRYLNSIQKQTFLNAFRNSAKVAACEFQWDFIIKVRTEREITKYFSSTHQLKQELANDKRTDISLTLQKGDNFGKAFSFYYTTQQFEKPAYALSRSDAGSSVMVSFIPKFCPLNVEDAAKQMIQNKGRQFEVDMDDAKGEYIFLLDRSGSMEGASIEKAKEALLLFLKSLPIDTYFQVVSFGSGSEKIFPNSLKNGNDSIKKAISLISKMGADLGGTQIYEPLKNILDSQIIKDYPKQIFLLTDGAVSDTEQVIDLVRKNTKYSRVHTIGIGSGVSRALITECAEKGKGHYIFIKQSEDPSLKIIQLLNDSFTPVISKVTLKYDEQLVESVVPNPEKVQYFLKGDIANFYITFKNHLTNPTEISLSYIDSLSHQPKKATIQVLPSSSSENFVDKLANFKRISAYEQAQAQNGNQEDYLYFVKKVDRKQQILDLSIRHQILSRYTAFICVETQLMDGRYQQIKAKGTNRVQIISVKKQPEPQRQYIEECCYQDQCAVNDFSAYQFQTAKMCDNIESQHPIPEVNFSSSSNNVKLKKNSTPHEPSIKDIIKEQLFEGYWDSQAIVRGLYKQEYLIQINKKANKTNMYVYYTYLVVEWIEKHHPEKQYSLIVKKARNWLKKQPHFSEIATDLSAYV